MAYTIYELESYNPKKKLWEHRTSHNSLANAKKNCKQLSKYEKKRWKITKEQFICIFDENGKIEK